MSDNIPLEIQKEIIKKVYDIKSLIQFRSVSKPWKSFIDSSDFIHGYGARHTQPHSYILTYKVCYLEADKYICLVDENDETFQLKKQELAPFVVSPFLKQYSIYKAIGACHGLLCSYGLHKGYNKWMVVVWNPSICKSFGIVVPNFYHQSTFGFGVCPVTRDPTVVKIKCMIGMPWYAEVFTLSSGVWNVIPCGHLPRQSIQFLSSTQVVIDRFIYWGASEMEKHVLVSFDLVTKGFKVVGLPDTLTKELCSGFSVFKLRESLVVFGFDLEANRGGCCGVWVMEHDSSFRKLFTIDLPFNYRIVGFRNNGESIFETPKRPGGLNKLDVYDPSSQQTKSLGICGVNDLFLMRPYQESLLLLDHSDLRIFSEDS